MVLFFVVIASILFQGVETPWWHSGAVLDSMLPVDGGRYNFRTDQVIAKTKPDFSMGRMAAEDRRCGS